MIATATFLGILAGARLWGTVADRVGRRAALQVTIVISSVFGGVAALAPDGWWLGACGPPRASGWEERCR